MGILSGDLSPSPEPRVERKLIQLQEAILRSTCGLPMCSQCLTPFSCGDSNEFYGDSLKEIAEWKRPYYQLLTYLHSSTLISDKVNDSNDPT